MKIRIYSKTILLVLSDQLNCMLLIVSRHIFRCWAGTILLLKIEGPVALPIVVQPPQE